MTDPINTITNRAREKRQLEIVEILWKKFSHPYNFDSSLKKYEEAAELIDEFYVAYFYERLGQ